MIQTGVDKVGESKVQDLLVPREGGLNVRQGTDGSFYVGELSKIDVERCEDNRIIGDVSHNWGFITCHSAKHLLRLLVLGAFNRHVASTKMNSESSRSHCVLSLYITAYQVGPDI